MCVSVITVVCKTSAGFKGMGSGMGTTLTLILNRNGSMSGERQLRWVPCHNQPGDVRSLHGICLVL